MPTPYEIRAELLSRATDYLTTRYHALFTQFTELNDMLALKSLTFPTTEEILALANTYKSFIDNK